MTEAELFAQAKRFAEAELAEVREKSASGDNESAHMAEARLRRIALEWIAIFSTDARAQEMADLAIESAKIEFDRWFA